MRAPRSKLLPLACCTGLIVMARAGAAQPAAADQCPTSNAPNELTLVDGSPQTAERGTAFAAGLQVSLANTNGCPLTTPLAGTPITFTAPAGGASGTFAASGSNTLTVGADAAGSAAAPGFTANHHAGTYTVVASSAYGAVSFTLTNSAAGVAATITPVAPLPRSATVGTRYPRRLRIRVRDADDVPLPGVTVTFTLGASGGPSGAGALFANGAAQATATTGSDGIASSPPLDANTTAGAFTATASAPNVAAPAAFHLHNRAGRPADITAGAASAEATQAGTRFTIPLAVTVTDAHHNPVAGVPVTFSAPGAGPSGYFSRRSHPTRVTVPTDAAGIAVAPPFVANSEPGGFVVRATVRGAARTAAFALVNDAP